MTFFLWNFVNLMDAEANWILKLSGILLGIIVFNHYLTVIIFKLHRKFQETHQVWKDTFVRALHQPIKYYTWCAVLAHCGDLVSDRFLSEQFFEEIKLIFSVLAVLMIAWFFLRWKKNLLEVLIEKQKLHEIQTDIGRIAGFNKLATAGIVILTILLLMEVTGQSFKTLIAFGGISGLALAIASQEIIGNFFGGFMIYVTRPFSAGDHIFLPSSNLEGDVQDIGWYQTCILGEDKRPIYIPNALFSKAYVINASRMTHRRIYDTISMRHDDLFVVPKIITELEAYFLQHPKIDSSEKGSINISRVGPYAIDILIAALSTITNEQEFLKLRDEIFLKVGEIIMRYGAKFAMPAHSFVPKMAHIEKTADTNEDSSSLPNNDPLNDDNLRFTNTEQ